VLGQYWAVREAVVMAREDEEGEKRLVAYVVTEEGVEPGSHELRSYLKEKLPEYMIPSLFVLLDELPLTANGKVDRRALPTPDSIRPDIPQGVVAPRSSTEATVVEIWCQVLHLEQVGIYDNFFELGGHSLLVTQLLSRLRAAFKIELPLRSLFEISTVAGQAEMISATLWVAQDQNTDLETFPIVSEESAIEGEV
jgi:acyl carrier protein